MTKKIMEVTEVTVQATEKNPSIISIISKGNVSSGGWSNARLIPYDNKQTPVDGIYNFDFVADAPSGISIDVISEIASKEILFDNSSKQLKGVKINASENYITSLISQDNNSNESLVRSHNYPFNEVTPEDLKKLLKNNDSFSITNAFIWEDVLTVDVTYSGGCKEHDFQLVWDGTVIKTLPPQIDLFIIHNNNQDPCKAMVSNELQFTLPLEILNQYEINLNGWSKKLNTKT